MPAALITGGAQRIGKAIARAFANKGIDIALHYHHSRDEAEETAEQIRNVPVQCQLFQADLSDTGSARHLMNVVSQTFPDTQILVNNASVFKRMDYSDTDEILFDEAINLHLKAPFFLIQQFARLGHHGLVINMLDTKITKELTSYMAYSLSKKSLADLTRLAAKALGPKIRVNGIAPGIILPSSDTSQTALDRLIQRIPLKQQGQPEQIAQAAVFLWENPFITGDILYLDGGEHLSD